MKTVLTIAASDPSGGAGIQADLRAISAHGLYGMAVPTALTVQNTLGVTGVHVPPVEILAAQLRAVLSDIPPEAVKIGAVPGAAHAQVVADLLREFHARNIVFDPVLASTSGADLGTAPVQTWLLDDDPAALNAARARGLRTAGIPDSGTPESAFAGADRILKRIDEWFLP